MDPPDDAGDAARRNTDTRRWTFLTNHARVLVLIARNPQARLRDIAMGIGITERAAQAIVNDLEATGHVNRTRIGRRNRYTVDPTRPFRHPAEGDQRIEGLLTLFAAHDDASRDADDRDAAAAEPVPDRASGGTPDRASGGTPDRASEGASGGAADAGRYDEA